MLLKSSPVKYDEKSENIVINKEQQLSPQDQQSVRVFRQLEITEKHGFEQEYARSHSQVKNKEFQADFNRLFPDSFNEILGDAVKAEEEHIGKNCRFVGKDKQGQQAGGNVEKKAPFALCLDDHDNGINRTDGIQSQFDSRHKAGHKNRSR